jgi:hypothetical protein
MTRLVLASSLFLPAVPAWGQSDLQTIRADVRRLSPGQEQWQGNREPTDARAPTDRGGQWGHYGGDPYAVPSSESSDSLTELVAVPVAMGITSPLWVPYMLTGDNYSVMGTFPHHPYRDGHDGYMRVGQGRSAGRGWAVRARSEYATEFDHLQRVGGRLLLSTSSRFGLDTQMDCLRESLLSGSDDKIWLGDLNVVFRFAQSETMQWRAGLGMNWLDDPRQSDFGFNFTYSVDFYPRHPWVVSAELDWGTLGHAELFRGRTTTGILIGGLETYVGYEYLDIDRTQTNSLIGGVQVWF